MIEIKLNKKTKKIYFEKCRFRRIFALYCSYWDKTKIGLFRNPSNRISHVKSNKCNIFIKSKINNLSIKFCKHIFVTFAIHS